MAESTLAFWHPFGPHGGETPDEILARKNREVEKNGWTLWSFQHRGPRTHDLWKRELCKARTLRVLVFCSKGRGRDPAGDRAQARFYRNSSQDKWVRIPPAVSIPHPFGKQESASAFWVKRILSRDEVPIPNLWQWFEIASEGWVSDRQIPTRPEFLLQGGRGMHLRDFETVLELAPPFVVEIKR